MMKLSESAIGQRVVMIEPMDNEVRWTFFERREGVAKYAPNPNKPTPYVTAYRLRVIQGVPGEKPRYDNGEIRTACEVDGRIDVVDASEITLYSDQPIMSERDRVSYTMAALKSNDPFIINAIENLVAFSKLSGIKPEYKFMIGDKVTLDAMEGPRLWQITDVGFRTVTAIYLDSKVSDGSWFNGPPYSVAESSFDEYDLPAFDRSLIEGYKNE